MRLAAVHRPVPDVARMIAILGDCSGMAAEDALREVAVRRPVSDLVLLAELLSDPTHAGQGRRPVAEPDPRVPHGPKGSGSVAPAPSAFAAAAPPARSPSAVVEAGTGLRWAGAVGLAVSGLALGSAIPSSVRTPPYAALWLALVGLVCLFLAGVTAVRAGRVARLAALAAGCATIATSLVARLAPGQDVGGWAADARGLIALGAGAVTAVCAAAFLARSTEPPSPWGMGRPVAFEPLDAVAHGDRPADTTRMLG
ncbi:hypothetical protein GT354_00605 [Streptomyces sp. SID3343]|nr:hypothetical protein [Streptomyces sp. SID3343]